MPTTLERTPETFSIPLGKQLAVKALIESGIPYREIAEEIEISPTTVTKIARRFPSNNQVVETLKKTLPATFYTMSTLAMANISPKKLSDSSALQLATVAGICVDKARDMEGSNRPIFNVVTVVNECKQTMDKLNGEIGALQSALARKRNITSTLLPSEQRSDLT